ncbi:Uncharacterised protein [uncultured Clostridium sp.]|nr:Uncharacterised protein [uncultured Clostridium sp.]
MSNNVIFNLDELFISVGIDVGADFSWMSIALPNQQLVGKPYKILHSSMNSLTTAVSKIKEAEELYSLESRIFLESTGIYHYPLFCYLRDKGFNCSVINLILSILVDTFISKISLPMQPVPEIRSISGA